MKTAENQMEQLVREKLFLIAELKATEPLREAVSLAQSS
jgi:hypothetical protein